MRRTTLGLSSLLAVAALSIAASGVAAQPARRSAYPQSNRPRPKPPRNESETAREIREWNEAVEQRKAEKKARNFK